MLDLLIFTLCVGITVLAGALFVGAAILAVVGLVLGAVASVNRALQAVTR